MGTNSEALPEPQAQSRAGAAEEVRRSQMWDILSRKSQSDGIERAEESNSKICTWASRKMG